MSSGLMKLTNKHSRVSERKLISFHGTLLSAVASLETAGDKDLLGGQLKIFLSQETHITTDDNSRQVHWTRLQCEAANLR